MSNLTLDVDQAGELKAAFRRGDWTNTEIKRLCEGNTLAEVRKILLGQAIITPRESAFKIENSITTMTVVTTEGVTLKLGVIRGEEFADDKRITKNIRAEADKRGWKKPPAETAPLIRELLLDDDLKEMGLVWLTVMHEPIADSHGNPTLLVVHRNDDGSWLRACYGKPDGGWDRGYGFLFLLPQ